MCNPVSTDALTPVQSELTHCKLFTILSLVCCPESVDALTPVRRLFVYLPHLLSLYFLLTTDMCPAFETYLFL